MATFVTVQPIEGEAGVTAVTVTAPEYTGRKQRTDTITFTTSSNKSAAVTVTQSGKAVSFTAQSCDQSVVNYGWINSNGGSGYIDISTNSRSLFFGWLFGTVTGATIVSPVAGEVTIADGRPSEDIAGHFPWKVITPVGDPGADGTYTIRIYLTFPANNGKSNRNCILRIIDVDTGSTWTGQFTQPAVITVSESALSPAAEGDSTQVTITSQEHWDASVDD